MSTVNGDSLQSELTYHGCHLWPQPVFQNYRLCPRVLRGALLVGMCIGYTGRSWLFTAVSLGILQSLCISSWGWNRITRKGHLIRVCVKMPIDGNYLLEHVFEVTEPLCNTLLGTHLNLHVYLV